MTNNKIKFLSWVSVVFYVVFVGGFAYTYYSVDFGVELLEPNESRMLAWDLYASKVQSLGTVSLTLLGVLWAFLIYRNTEIRVTGCSAWRMFVSANLFFGSSFLIYLRQYDLSVSHLNSYGPTDLAAPFFQLLASAQWVSVVLGVVVTGALILTCRKENSSHASN